MKVLVLGPPRSGTQSLSEALVQLGVSPVYHMKEVAKNGHQDLWIRALEVKYENAGAAWKRQDFEQILAGNEGVADIPAAAFAEELVEAYPEAVIILSTRSEDAWYQSMVSTLWHLQRERGPDSTSPMAPLSMKLHTHCWRNDFPAYGHGYFQKHNALVRKLGAGRKFLEYNVKDGWDPLCEFLSVPVPDTPFPRMDDWVEYKKKVLGGMSKDEKA